MWPFFTICRPFCNGRSLVLLASTVVKATAEVAPSAAGPGRYLLRVSIWGTNPDFCPSLSWLLSFPLLLNSKCRREIKVTAGTFESHFWRWFLLLWRSSSSVAYQAFGSWEGRNRERKSQLSEKNKDRKWRRNLCFLYKKCLDQNGISLNMIWSSKEYIFRLRIKESCVVTSILLCNEEYSLCINNSWLHIQ